METLFRHRRSLVRMRAVSFQLETTLTQQRLSAIEKMFAISSACRMQNVDVDDLENCFAQDTRVAAICEQGRCSGTTHLDARILDQSRSGHYPCGLCSDLQGSPNVHVCQSQKLHHRKQQLARKLTVPTENYHFRGHGT